MRGVEEVRDERGEAWGRGCGWYKASAWACGFSKGSTRPDLLFKGFPNCRRVRMPQEGQSGGYHRSPGREGSSGQVAAAEVVINDHV